MHENVRKIDKIAARNDSSVILYDGYEEALCGYSVTHDNQFLACYEYQKCLNGLMADGMDIDEAIEFFDFNTLGTYVEGCPVFVTFVNPSAYASKQAMEVELELNFPDEFPNLNERYYPFIIGFSERYGEPTGIVLDYYRVSTRLENHEINSLLTPREDLAIHLLHFLNI